jgi:MFS superfamily sulfate permease-like transporter
MTWKEILAIPVALVGLAFLLGVGALAWNIGDTWQARNTDILITGLVTACGGGMVIMGVLLGVVIGVPFMLRMMRESATMRPDYWPPAQTIDGQWRQLPGDAQPLLTMQQQPQQFPVQGQQAQPFPVQGQQAPMMMGVSLDALDNDSNFGEW